MLEKGLTFSCKTTVDATNLASVMGSGDMDVFATPAMVALMEKAAMCAVANELMEGTTTVGTQIHVSHVKASSIGELIEATATLTEVEGRKLVFSVSAKDSKGLIGEGSHCRFIVEKARFLAKLIKSE